MRTRSHLFVVCAIVLAVGCKDEVCKVETFQYTQSLTATGFAGATQGVNLARFDLTQDFVSHTPYAACAQGPLQDVGNVDLKITSLVAAPVVLHYDVQGLNADGLMVWSARSDTLGVTLQPNQTLSLGVVATSPQPLGTGGARVLLQGAEYLP